MELNTEKNLTLAELSKLPMLKRLEVLTSNPMEYQKNFLMKVISDNKDVEYGKKYNFSEINSIEDFQKNVPVTTYDDYAEYIYKMTEEAKDNLLTVNPIVHYNKSSGTVGNPKRIPMTEDFISQIADYNNKYPKALLMKNFGTDWADGTSLNLVESVSNLASLKNGITYSALSVMMSSRKSFMDNYTITSPKEAIFPQPDTNTRYLHARFGLMDKWITNVTATFASFFLEILRYIEHNWEMLVNDIEKGTIDPSVKMADEVRESLLAKIKPMPERAQELRKIFSDGFSRPIMPRLWPKCQYIMTVGTGSFKVYVDTIREKYSGATIHNYMLGYVASEGLFSVPFNIDSTDSVFTPDTVFFEFLPLDAEDDFSKIVTLDGLEENKLYEVIITNCSGFYRYRMRDVVKITGKYNNTPTMEFMYRRDNTVSLMGEKTTEVALRQAITETAKDCGFELIDFSVYPDFDSTPARYTYFIETGMLPEGLKPKEIRYVLDKKLAKANPSMGDKIKNGTCAATKLNFLEPETYMLYRDMMRMKGVDSAQLKPVTVISTDMQKKFFFGMTEYSVEYIR